MSKTNPKQVWVQPKLLRMDPADAQNGGLSHSDCYQFKSFKGS